MQMLSKGKRLCCNAHSRSRHHQLHAQVICVVAGTRCLHQYPYTRNLSFDTRTFPQLQETPSGTSATLYVSHNLCHYCVMFTSPFSSRDGVCRMTNRASAGSAGVIGVREPLGTGSIISGCNKGNSVERSGSPRRDSGRSCCAASASARALHIASRCSSSSSLDLSRLRLPRMPRTAST